MLEKSDMTIYYRSEPFSHRRSCRVHELPSERCTLSIHCILHFCSEYRLEVNDHVEQKDADWLVRTSEVDGKAGAGVFPDFSVVARGSPRNQVFTNDHHGLWSQEAGVWQEIHLALYQPRAFCRAAKETRDTRAAFHRFLSLLTLPTNTR